MKNKNFNRRNFLSAATILGISLPLNSVSSNNDLGDNDFVKSQTKNINLNDISEVGVIVSTHPKRGQFRTADFNSDVEAVQYAYDEYTSMNNRKILTLAVPFLILACLFLFISCISCSKEDIVNEKKQAEPDKNTWIFLMAGQSNMAGRGTIEAQDLVTDKRILTINSKNEWITAKEPIHFYESSDALDCGMSFAQELLKHVPDSVTIAMVPCAVGGSSVFQWLSDEEHRNVKLFTNFTEKAQLSKKKGVIKGILWHQGERNANETDLPKYKEALIQLFSRFRASVENNNLSIILGEIGHFAEPEEKAAYFGDINQIIRNVTTENGNLYYVSSEGLDHRGDHLHFDSEAQRELGRRYAMKYLEILKN